MHMVAKAPPIVAEVLVASTIVVVGIPGNSSTGVHQYR